MEYSNTEGGYEVSKDVFFAKVGPMNVHPRSEREVTYWETPSRRLIGTSRPGYMGGSSYCYFLLKEAAQS